MMTSIDETIISRIVFAGSAKPPIVIIDSMRLLAACEGIFGETAGGVTLGVLRKLLASGQLDPDAETVIFNSGDGLKTLDAVSSVVHIPSAIRPTLDAFNDAVFSFISRHARG